MSIEDKKQELNALMTEYSQLKDNPANKAKCQVLMTEAANIILSSVLFAYLKEIVRRRLNGRYTYRGLDEFVVDNFFSCVSKYNCEKNDNFYNFFVHSLRAYQVTNGTRSENSDMIDGTVIQDDEGHETPIIDTRPDDSASPETLGIMQLFNNISKTSTDSTSKNPIDTMQKLFDVEESISEDEAQIRVRFIEYISKIIPCINQANEHRGKRNVYYRAFATDFYIAASKWSLHSRYDMNENEAFRNMDLAFADWVLTAICRSFTAFETTPCKTYEEIGVVGRDYANGEIETPFKNGVYAVRFKVTESAVSQQWGYFYKDIGILVNEER